MTAHGGVEYKLHDCVVGGCPGRRGTSVTAVPV
jgi:hypothetical protein